MQVSTYCVATINRASVYLLRNGDNQYRYLSLVAIIIIICGSIWTFKKEQPDLFWISKNHSKSGFELSVQNWALDSGYKLKGIAIFTLLKVTRSFVVSLHVVLESGGAKF